MERRDKLGNLLPMPVSGAQRAAQERVKVQAAWAAMDRADYESQHETCSACSTRPMLHGNGTPDMCAECALTGALARVLAAVERRTADGHLVGYVSLDTDWHERSNPAITRAYNALAYAREVADALGIDVTEYDRP